jgi:D-sedoheptulose 7-phosphate isomerase
MDHVLKYANLVSETSNSLDHSAISQLAYNLKSLREQNGRLFILGVGGSAANASHAVNDFRKLCNIETYAPTDNVSELTARTNDDGWDTVFSKWLQVSRLNNNDAILVLSVGGGNAELNVSPNLIKALDYAKSVSAKIYGIVGRDGGYTAKLADTVVIIPSLAKDLVTPLAEAFQAVIWHCLVSHPELQVQNTKW